MDYKNLYEQLLKSHEALQLRVTQFSKVEQDLIQTRDLLDQEALMYRRMSRFNLKAIDKDEPQDLLQLIVESIIDIFEVEAAVAFYICPEGQRLSESEGVELEPSKRWQLFADICDAPHHKPNESGILFPYDLPNPMNVEFMHQAFVYHKTDNASQNELMLIAFNSVAKKQWYTKLDPRHNPIFTIYGQIAEALLVKSEINKALARQNDELTKANRELDQFVYSVSHDLRSPLLAIKGILDLLQTEQHEDTKNKYFELATDSIERLDNSIEEILNYSRNARVDVSPTSFDLIKLIRETVDANRHSSSGRVSVSYETPADLMVHTDHIRLTVILRNLISNALKYGADQNGHTKIRIRTESSSPGTKVFIRDFGPGIKEEIMPRIFDMFYRGTTASRGSGLGLYIVKETVTKLGGTVKARTMSSGGTEFEVFIPENK